jgi:hypothetical protein
MHSIATELENLIKKYGNSLASINEAIAAIKPSPFKWSKKELVGHLIDSAQNNIRRILISQYEVEPHIVYNQDAWVNLNHYQEREYHELVQLFLSLNKQLAFIINNVPEKNQERMCRTEALHSIQWLAKDYLLHLKHHLHQILDLEPVAYP